MRTTLLILSYVGKIAGFVGTLSAIPHVSPTTGVIIFFVASILKDTANRITEFLQANFIKVNAAPLAVGAAAFLLFAAGFTLTACNGLTAGEQRDLSAAQSYAWTVANAFQTTDGQAITSDILSTSLSVAGASPKTIQEAAIAKKLTDDTLKLAVTAHAIGASSTTLKTTQATLLADPNVVESAASAAATGGAATPLFQPPVVQPGS